MIRFECPSCGKSIKVGEEKAGKQGKCPACGGSIAVPGGEVSDADVLAMFGVASSAEEPQTAKASPKTEPKPERTTADVAGFERSKRARDKRSLLVLAGLVGIVFVGVMLVGFVEMIGDRDRPSRNQPPALAGHNAAEAYIPGLAAVDVHGNFTNKGFTLSKRLDPVQSEWKCIDDNGQRMMLVEAFGPSPTKITMVRGTYAKYGGTVGSEAVEFLGFIASIPYDGSSPSEARDWVVSNVGSNATKTIGGAKFELSANQNTRMLIIAPR